jgi:hypothetical protein
MMIRNLVRWAKRVDPEDSWSRRVNCQSAPIGAVDQRGFSSQ